MTRPAEYVRDMCVDCGIRPVRVLPAEPLDQTRMEIWTGRALYCAACFYEMEAPQPDAPPWEG